jgi:hypothetical protein
MNKKAITPAPAISVVLPIYNTESYLSLVLESLLSQSERDLEIIAVDDGSTDGSLALLRTAAHADARIKVLAQANKGMSAARNLALEQARGRWIAFVDSDDWLAPQTLQVWRERAERDALDLLIGNCFRFRKAPTEAHKPVLKKQPWHSILTGKQWIVHAVAVREWPNWVWLQLIRHDLIRQTGARFVEGMLHEDTPWTLQIALAAQRVGFVQTPLYGYRRRPGSSIKTKSVATLHVRARSHVQIAQLLVATAAREPAGSALGDALLRDVNSRGKDLFSILKSQLRDPALRAEIAREFIAAGLMPVMFRGGGGVRNFSRGLNCWLRARWYLRNQAIAGGDSSRAAR